MGISTRQPTHSFRSARSPGLLCAIFAACLASGCGTVEKDKRAIGLQAATHGYQSALRWGYYETAYGFVHPDLRKDKPLNDLFIGLRLTGYDVVQPPTLQDKDSATQIVTIEYLHEDRQVVKRLSDRQLWRWDEKLDSWWLQSGLPTFDE
jgi:hypothetical protein